MHRTFSLIAAAAVALSLAGAAGAAPCKDPTTGKFMKCPAATAPAAGGAASAAAGGYTLDAKGRCHDSKGKMAKKSMCSGSATATASTPTSGGGMVTRSASTTTTTTSSASGPHCTKGKRCGNACISVNDVCHKP